MVNHIYEEMMCRHDKISCIMLMSMYNVTDTKQPNEKSAVDDQPCHFNPSDNVSVEIASLTYDAFRWAVAQAVGESIAVEIGEDYRYLDMVCAKRWDSYMGDPLHWYPDLDRDLSTEFMVKHLLTVGPCTPDGTQWFAQSFSNPSVRAEAETFGKAICLALVLQHSGPFVVVPRQLQRLEQCRQEALEERERAAAEVRKDDQNDQYYELQDSFR